jgi:DNA-binding NtrC family response regulator
MLAQSKIKVAIVDDEAQMREMLKDFVEQKIPAAGISTYTSGEEALEKIFDEPHVVILDYHLDSKDSEAMNGVQVLKKLKDRYPDVNVIFVSGQEKAEIAANTMKYGAYDYIVKNENTFNRLEIVMKNILGNTELKKSAVTQKFFNYLLVALIAALVIGIVVMRME